MPTGALTAALVTGAATTGGGLLASKFLGGKSKKSSSGSSGSSGGGFTGFNAGGLTAGMGAGGIGVTSDANRTGLVGNLSATFPQQVSQISKLRESVAPGISGLRASRLQEIENARRSSVGNLRENLQRRRVLGSSFGQDAITRAEAEFGQQKERVAAESFLQEIEMTHQLIGEEFELRRGEFQTKLGELNLQADIATKLSAGATAQLGAMSRLEAELAANSAAASGKFFGDTFKPVFDQLGESLSGRSASSENSSIARAA